MNQPSTPNSIDTPEFRKLLLAWRLADTATELQATHDAIVEYAEKSRTPADPVVAEGWRQALHAAVSALYFDDSSDFKSALGAVVRHLDRDLAGELLGSPKVAYDKACAILSAHPVAGSPAEFKALFVQWWQTDMDNSEFFNRAVKMLGIANDDLHASCPATAEPKLVLALPDYDKRQIVIASDEVIDGERLVCIAVESESMPASEGSSICNDTAFMDALDSYVDAVANDERNTDRRVNCRLAIFAAADAWRSRTVTPVPASEALSETQVYRTGYGEGVRRAAQMMEDHDLPVMAELIRNLQSSRVPASEAVSVRDAERYLKLRDWYFRGGQRSEIDPHGHIRVTTNEIFDAGVDALQAQSVRDAAQPTIAGLNSQEGDAIK